MHPSDLYQRSVSITFKRKFVSLLWAKCLQHHCQIHTCGFALTTKCWHRFHNSISSTSLQFRPIFLSTSHHHKTQSTSRGINQPRTDFQHRLHAMHNSTWRKTGTHGTLRHQKPTFGVNPTAAAHSAVLEPSSADPKQAVSL